MKEKYIILIIFLGVTCCVNAQTQESELSVIGAGGEYHISETRVLHSSIGESVVSYGVSESGKVLQSGFIQNFNNQEISVEEDDEKACTIELEPIIAIDNSNGLQWNNLPSNSDYNLTIFHRNGNILHQEVYDRANPYSGENLKAGNYLYVISNQHDKSCLNSAVTIVK